MASRRKRVRKGRRISLRELERLERRIESAREKLGVRRPKGFAPPKEVPVTKVKRKRFIRLTDLRRIVDDLGPDDAVDVAREYDFHPDEWAEDIGEDYDLDVHGLYEQYFYPQKETG